MSEKTTTATKTDLAATQAELETRDYSDEALPETSTGELVNTSTGELVPAVRAQSAAELYNAGTALFKTFEAKPGEEFQDAVKVFGALNNAEPIADHLNEVINLRHIVATNVVITDRITGQPVELTRIVLVDDEGNSFAAISNGLYRSVQNILGSFPPVHTWPAPLPIKIVSKRAARGNYFTAQLAV